MDHIYPCTPLLLILIIPQLIIMLKDNAKLTVTDEGSRAETFCFFVCFDATISSITFRQVKST